MNRPIIVLATAGGPNGLGTDRPTSATLLSEVATEPSRVFITAKLARGRLLLVDSTFDEPVASPPYEVVSLRVPR